MVRKLRVGLALQPIATALFANSPFTDGKPNGFQSYRAEIWRDTDPDRTGLLPFAFEPRHGLRALRRLRARCADVFRLPQRPLYRRGRRFIPRLHAPDSLRRCQANAPTLDDWADHLTTLFPDVRLKRFLEMRGADAGAFPQLLPACRPSGSGCSTIGLRSSPPPTYRRLDRGRAAGLARCGSASRAQGAVPRRHRARRCARHGSAGASRLGAPRPARSLRQGRSQVSRSARRDCRDGPIGLRPPARRLSRRLARRHRQHLHHRRALTAAPGISRQLDDYFPDAGTISFTGHLACGEGAMHNLRRPA